MIRNCKVEDFNEIILLIKQLFPDKEVCTNNLKIILENMLNSDNCVLLCVVKDNLVIGFCSLVTFYDFWIEDKISYITSLIIDEKHRGIGIGKALLKEVELISVKNGCKKIDLASSFHRDDAHKFYEANGFEKWAYFFTKQL